MLYDVVIVGGGPAGLSAALTLGRGRKRVLLCDSGPRRNAAAAQIHNFVTRDGTPPDEFRAIARRQLTHYPNVTVWDERVAGVTGERGAFRVSVGAESVEARRLLLCMGMIDEMLAIDGFVELWGRSVFQCPYCHGWEVQDRPWGYLVVDSSHFLAFALQLRGWTTDVVVFTNGAFEIPRDARERVEAAGIRVETAPVIRLAARDGRLEAVELAGNIRVEREVLFAHPPQRHVELVRNLSLDMDEDGSVRVDPVRRETSIPGIYAAGDLTTRMQAAMHAAASGAQTGAALNVELTLELSAAGLL